MRLVLCFVFIFSFTLGFNQNTIDSAHVHFENGEYSVAIEEYLNLISKTTDEKILEEASLNAAKAYYFNHESEKAQELALLYYQYDTTNFKPIIVLHYVQQEANSIHYPSATQIIGQKLKGAPYEDLAEFAVKCHDLEHYVLSNLTIIEIEETKKIKDPDLLYIKAKNLMFLEEFESAEPIFKKLYKSKKENAEYNYYYTIVLMNLTPAKLDKANQLINKALQLKKGKKDYLYARGQIQMTMDNYGLALKDYKKVGTEYWDVLHLDLANVYMKQKQYDLAVKHFSIYQKMYPNNLMANKYLGLVYYKQKDLASACEYINNSYEIMTTKGKQDPQLIKYYNKCLTEYSKTL